jgi:glutaredoxin
MYSKDDCPWCDKARDLLAKRDIPVKELKLGKDYTKSDLIMRLMFSDAKITVPQIWVVDGLNIETHIGGYEALLVLDIAIEK